MEYQLEINENQAKIISSALDLYSRIAGGQFEEILKFYWHSDQEKISKAKEVLTDLKVLLTGIKPNQLNIGLHDICEDAKVAYDLHQVIRYKLAHDRPHNTGDILTVDFDTPRQISEEPMAEIVPKNT